MRNYFIALLAIVFAACGSEDTGDPRAVLTGKGSGRIVARVTGFRNAKGRVIARLYRGGKGFPSDGAAAYRETTVAIGNRAALVTFTDVPHGEYALWICHDEDGDGELDTNFIKMPKEGVGVSGPPPTFIPRYKDARFTLDGELSEHDIELEYL